MQSIKAILKEICDTLRQEARRKAFTSSNDFERRVREAAPAPLELWVEDEHAALERPLGEAETPAGDANAARS